jgi:peptidoglycan/LPS O-acetylase OafA/YrhL
VRALAVAAVLAFHDGRLDGGFLGVSTFFTLSGFLITGLLLREWRDDACVSLRLFFARRLRRLVPAAVAGVFVAAAVAVAAHDAQISRRFPFDGIAAIGDFANWRFLAVGQSYAGLFATPSPLLHYWSLAVEEQFYLVLAPLIAGMLVVLRGRRAPMFGALATLGAISFAAGWTTSGHGIDRAYYGTDARAVEFIVGSLLAVAMSGRVLSRRASRTVAVVGPIALAAMMWANAQARVGDRLLFRGGLLAYACLGCVVVLAACRPGPIRALCSTAPARGLGRISYGVYVYHWPIFLWLSSTRTGLPPIVLTLLRVAVTLALATASFVFLERPIRERRALIGRRRWIAVPIAGVAAAACAVLVGAVGVGAAGDLCRSRLTQLGARGVTKSSDLAYLRGGEDRHRDGDHPRVASGEARDGRR